MAYSDEVLADSPIAYWRLGTGATDVDDSSGNSRPLTKVGTLAEASSLLPSDAANGARTMVGSASNYYEVPAASDTPFEFTGTASYSMEAWVRMDLVDGNFRRILDHCDLTNGWTLLVTSVGFQFYRFVGGVSVNNSFSPGSLTGETYHLVGTFDGSDLRLYVNGSLGDGPDASAGSVAAINQAVRTGLGASATNFMSGVLDEVAVYGTALSGARILAHYNAGITTVEKQSFYVTRRRTVAR